MDIAKEKGHSKIVDMLSKPPSEPTSPAASAPMVSIWYCNFMFTVHTLLRFLVSTTCFMIVHFQLEGT